MTVAYYNEINPDATQYLRNLIEAGHIAPGYVVKSDHRNTLAFGFDSLMNGGTSRNSARNAAFLIQPPVLAAWMGGRKPCRLASAVPGLSTRPSRRPHLTVGASVSKPEPDGEPGICLVDDAGGRLESSAAATGLCGDMRPGPTNGYWSSADWLGCRDGKWRPVEPGTFPLAHGSANRVGRLRGYGNAINAKAAQAFIESVMEAA